MSFFWSILQASPSDPENFPFVVLGNKVDVDGGNSRVVSPSSSRSVLLDGQAIQDCLKLVVQPASQSSLAIKFGS